MASNQEVRMASAGELEPVVGRHYPCPPSAGALMRNQTQRGVNLTQFIEAEAPL